MLPDAAFNLLPAGTVAALLNDVPQLTDILKHHVIADSVTSAMLSNGQMVMILGTDITVTINASAFIDNAQVTLADLVADNGVVHVIDAVLLPTTDCNGIMRNCFIRLMWYMSAAYTTFKLMSQHLLIIQIYTAGEYNPAQKH